MKLSELEADGFIPHKWTISSVRGERFMVFILRHKCGDGYYEAEAHAPLSNTTLLETNFTRPTILKKRG